VINYNLYHILHRFGDTAFDRFKIAIYWLPLLRLTTPTEAFPWNDIRKILPADGQGTKMT